MFLVQIHKTDFIWGVSAEFFEQSRVKGHDVGRRIAASFAFTCFVLLRFPPISSEPSKFSLGHVAISSRPVRQDDERPVKTTPSVVCQKALALLLHIYTLSAFLLHLLLSYGQRYPESYSLRNRTKAIVVRRSKHLNNEVSA